MDMKDAENLSEDEWINILMTTNLKFCPYYIFERKIKNRNILIGVIS